MEHTNTAQPVHQHIEQRRSNQAWQTIQSIKNTQNVALEKEYRTLARNLNTLIQVNGLGQTLGFLKAKGGSHSSRAHYLLLQHLTNWMQEHFYTPNSAIMRSGHDGLLRWLMHEQTSSADYRRATTECLAFANWLRRFAEGELQEPDAGENQ